MHTGCSMPSRATAARTASSSRDGAKPGEWTEIDAQPVGRVALVPGLDVGQRAQRVGAAEVPELDEHGAADLLVHAQRRDVDPRQVPGERRRGDACRRGRARGGARYQRALVDSSGRVPAGGVWRRSGSYPVGTMSTPQPPSSHGPDDERGMSGLQRALIALAGLALLLLAFVIFQSVGGDDGGSSEERTTAAQTATATATTDDRDGHHDRDRDDGHDRDRDRGRDRHDDAGAARGAARPDDPRRRRPAARRRADAVLRARRADPIQGPLDTADEVHVHGFDVTKAVPAGGTALLSFDANLEGRFEVELHGSGAQIAELEVSPS